VSLNGSSQGLTETSAVVKVGRARKARCHATCCGDGVRLTKSNVDKGSCVEEE